MARNEVRDSRGYLMYYTQMQGSRLVVIDNRGCSLGYCENGKTLDTHGYVVAKGEVPGILYKGDK